MKCWLASLIASLVVVGPFQIEGSLTHTCQSDDELGALFLGDYLAIAEAIGALPAWQPDRDFTESEWVLYLAVANALGQSKPIDVLMALNTYDVITVQRYPERDGSRCMLLLRILFDIPESDEARTLIGGPDEQIPDAIPMGGLLGKPVSIEWRNDRRVAAPVCWQDGKPTLSHFRGIGGGNGTRYNVLLEFRSMAKRYEYRPLGESLPEQYRDPWPALQSIIDASRRENDDKSND